MNEGKLIAVVDDERIVLDCVADALERAGFVTVRLPDAITLLARMFGANERFDLTLIDLVTPHLDGATAVRIVRAIQLMAGEQRARILLFTGLLSGDASKAEVARLADVEGFITKPVDLDGLLDAVNEALKGHS